MTTHSITLAWKIPWTEEPGRLYSVGLQRVGRDWETSLSLLERGGSISVFMSLFCYFVPKLPICFTCSDPITAFFAVAWSWLLLFVARIERGFPGGSVGKESACNSGEAGDLGSIFWVGKISWRRTWQLTPVSLSEESPGQRSLWATFYRVTNSQTSLKWLSMHARLIENLSLSSAISTHHPQLCNKYSPPTIFMCSSNTLAKSTQAFFSLSNLIISVATFSAK